MTDYPGKQLDPDREYKYDEVTDQMHYRMHKIDFVIAFDATARNAGGPIPSMAFIEEILDRLTSDWDDDAEGINSEWLEGIVNHDK